ncbi:hypothetical protein M413DRAFT_447645 [Hebeloma cylindrosporum]|uniref:Uncharacterized protein n=1 Tax=Hebeloma cylindrosporum TaxID=76867 RepID=A0A0C2YCH2_HEBCY|nr:hypothetical protein M413DRAFT_447645 [Hebeloma cylindrosporum h7]
MFCTQRWKLWAGTEESRKSGIGAECFLKVTRPWAIKKTDWTSNLAYNANLQLLAS